MAEILKMIQSFKRVHMNINKLTKINCAVRFRNKEEFKQYIDYLNKHNDIVDTLNIDIDIEWRKFGDKLAINIVRMYGQDTNYGIRIGNYDNFHYMNIYRYHKLDIVDNLFK